MISEVVPEPAGDIRAQIAAVLDPSHPKRAAFLVPEDAVNLQWECLPEGVYAASREEGVLITTLYPMAEAFEACPSEQFDRVMAVILGYPEAKPDIEMWCQGNPARARVVQARDPMGHVIQEAIASGPRLLDTAEAFKPYGELVILQPAAALQRRIALRWVQS